MPYMKLIQCIIRPEKLNDLVDRMGGVASGLTVSDVRGHGHQKGQPAVYRGLEYQVSLLPKTMVEIVADENRVEVRILVKMLLVKRELAIRRLGLTDMPNALAPL